jgi:hypothetical protein
MLLPILFLRGAATVCCSSINILLIVPIPLLAISFAVAAVTAVWML